MLRRTFALACLLLAGTCCAQQGETPGSIIGTVTCSDTQKPARFVNVSLVRIPDADDDAKKAKPAPGTFVGRGNSFQSVQTDLQGAYVLEGVAPGDYYVTAVVTGYISPVTSVLLSMPPDSTTEAMAAALPRVHVDPGGMVRSDIRMERGGAIAGTISFDDGTIPAVAILRVDRGDKPLMESLRGSLGSAIAMAGASMVRFAVPDDRGRYRLSGLAPGEYRVVATLQTGGGYGMRGGLVNMGAMVASPVTVYAPGAFHRDQGQVVKLGPGDDREDVNLVVNMTGLHSVSGHVASAVDHHAVNGGVVRLTDSNDSTLMRMASVDANGNYVVRWLPAGTYSLTVEGGADREVQNTKNGPQVRMLRSYDSPKLTVVVDATDVTGTDVELKERKSGSTAAGDTD